MLSEKETTGFSKDELLSHGVIVASSCSEVGEPSFRSTAYASAASLDILLRRWKGSNTTWAVLQGQRVLDLASGSAGSFGSWLAMYPHFARFCAINGARVVAIDIKPQRGIDRELFDWAAEDLVEAVIKGTLSVLPILKGKKFDIIHSSNFVGVNACPKLCRQLDNLGMKVWEFEQLFFDQAGELLAEEGVMALDLERGKRRQELITGYYTKKRGEIVQLERPLTNLLV